MNIINFAQLSNTDFEIKSLFAMHQRWHEGFTFRMNSPRITSCLLLFEGCDGIYETADKGTLEIKKGSLIYIPQGSVYSTRFINSLGAQHSTTLIEFELNKDGAPFCAGDEITVLSRSISPILKEHIYETVEIYSANLINYPKLRSSVYRILSFICEQHRRQTVSSREFGLIAKGIEYMENDAKQQLSIDEVARLCNVSPSCFRRLFKKYSGVSPVDYRINAKIEYAKKLLQGGADSVTEIASTLGFNDPSYFCRIFKKRVGSSPLEFSKSFKS